MMLTRRMLCRLLVLISVMASGCRTMGESGSSWVKSEAQPGTNPCDGDSEGMQSCGATWQLDPNKVYQCEQNVAVPVQKCANGCLIQPDGVPDNCKSDPSTPAAIQSLCDAHAGNIINGVPEKVQRCGGSNKLYACDGRTAVLAQDCPAGCNSQPNMLWDLCAPSASDPCENSGGGFSLTCGGLASSGGLNNDVLYSCYEKVSNPFQFCVNGCEKGAGGLDRCVDPCNDAAIAAVKNFSGMNSSAAASVWTQAPGKSYHVSFGAAATWLVNFTNGCSSTPTIFGGSLQHAN